VKVLVTGGAGYIGSHACVELLGNGHEVVVVDNFCNSDKAAIDGVRDIAKKDFLFVEADLRDEKRLEGIFAAGKFDLVMHFAGLKAVGESVAKPLEYYGNNVISTMNLCRAMQAGGVNKIIFSSSATVYSAANEMPLTEESALGCSNPYGWSKFMCEQVLRDFAVANNDFSVVLLRYFNPIGAHESGIIGENPGGIPNNLMPFVAQTARGVHAEVKVFGDDYDTPDGTGVRDYIHVSDLVKGHVLAMDFAAENTGCEAFNLGTGRGISVLELIETFKRVNGVDVPYSIAARRAGDIATVFADPAKAEGVLGFKATKSTEEMCADTWRFQLKHE
jgi:UDP-glucose 4-epimerase